MTDDLESIPETPPVKARHPLVTPVRIILFALLAVAIAGLIVDRMARKSANEAFLKLDGKLGPEQKLNAITKEEVQAIVGRAPDDDDDAEDGLETYTWQGALKQQILYVQYRQGKEAVLKDVSLNDPPAGF